MSAVLVARAPIPWHRIPLTVLAVAAQLAVAIVVIVFRIARVVVDLAAATAVHAEQQLAARTGRPALSQTGIGALAVALIAEFRTGYHQSTH